MTNSDDGFAWQVGVWTRMSDVYAREIDARFTGVVRGCIERAALRPGERVLDLGAGTGMAALAAAHAVGPDGAVLGVDISPEMLALAEKNAAAAGVDNVRFREGRAEEIPAEDADFDVVIASLSLMYALDREGASRECARVLRPGGRLVAAVWAGPDEADIVKFQQAAGRFTPPPVPGVGPGALADPSPFLAQLDAVGITATVETETITFEFDSFDQAWDILAGVTTAGLDDAQREEAKRGVQDLMWPDPSQRRQFANRTQFLVGQRVS